MLGILLASQTVETLKRRRWYHAGIGRLLARFPVSIRSDIKWTKLTSTFCVVSRTFTIAKNHSKCKRGG